MTVAAAGFHRIAIVALARALFVEGAFSGTEHVCETLDGLAARTVSNVLNSLVIDFLTRNESSPKLEMVSQTCFGEAPPERGLSR